MSSHDLDRPVLDAKAAGMSRRGMLAAGLSAMLLAGCSGGFQPLYGPGFSSGLSGGASLAEVEIGIIPGRVGQVLRNELIFKTRGGAAEDAVEPRYRLEIALRQTAQNLLVNLSGDSEGLMFGLDAEFKVVSIADNRVILAARSIGRASYQKVESVYANLRARRDAEDRAARAVADDIRTRIAAALIAERT